MRRRRRRGCFLLLGLAAALLLGLPGRGMGYLLSPAYVLKRMIGNYRLVRSVTINQQVEAYGEDPAFPIASVDEKVELEPIVPLKIWIGGKPVPPEGDLDPGLDINPYLIEAQRRYGFYKDVFLNHQLNLITSLLGRLGIAPVEDRLRLVYPNAAYQIGSELTHENLKGLWVEKERFIPLRLVGTLIGERNGASHQETIDIRYEDYRHLSGRIWFPHDVKFFINGKLALRMRAASVSLTTYSMGSVDEERTRVENLA